MSMIFPSGLFTNHYGESSSRGLSPRLWSKIQAHGSSPDGLAGYYISDDFMNIALTGGVAVSSNVSYYTSAGGGQYKSYEDSTGVVGQSLAYNGGVLSMATDAGDNDENWIQNHGGVFGAINYDSGPKLTIFETRFRTSTVVDDVQAIFLGLSEEARAVADQKANDTGVLADKDYIGFDTVHTNGGTTGANAALNFVYNKASGAGPITGISAVKTLVADTWYKVGFVYNPYDSPSNRLVVYVDGVENTNHITASEIDNSTDFPDGEELNFLAGQKAGTTTAGTLLIDWYAFYQEG
jgi:hypothetical protein